MEKILAAGGLVLNKKNELLMIFRRSKWDLPKGHLDKGETAEQCALREVEEETGLDGLMITEFVGITTHEYFDGFLEKNAVKEVHWFKMQTDNPHIFHPQIEEGIEWIRWISKNELRNFLNSSYQNLREIIAKAGLL